MQILYSTEAIRVNVQSLTTSSNNEERGKEMLRVGKMSKADLAQLTAQRVQEEYNLIEARSTLDDFKRQLKQLLQLTDDEEFKWRCKTFLPPLRYMRRQWNSDRR